MAESVRWSSPLTAARVTMGVPMAPQATGAVLASRLNDDAQCTRGERLAALAPARLVAQELAVRRARRELWDFDLQDEPRDGAANTPSPNAWTRAVSFASIGGGGPDQDHSAGGRSRASRSHRASVAAASYALCQN